MKNDLEYDAHFQEGLKRFKSQRYAESLEEFFLAAQIDPSSSDLHYYIGEALERNKEQASEAFVDQPEKLKGRSGRLSKATGELKKSETVVKGKKRDAERYKTQIPIIVVAYDVAGKFFAELAMTKVTSVKGACIEMQRRMKNGAQMMIFTVDSRNAVPAIVKNVTADDARARYQVGIEFLKAPVDWLLPSQSK